MIYYVNKSIIDNTDFIKAGINYISPSDFLQSNSIKEEDNLIVTCELDINTNNKSEKRSDFYGISFVQELRRKNYKNKVLFVSFLPKNYFFKKKVNSRILFFPGHNFLQLPASPSELSEKFQSFEGLTELSLYDVKHHYCGIEQIIDEHFHRITPKYNAAKKLTSVLIEEGVNLLKLVYEGLNKPLPETSEILHSEISGPEALRSLRSFCEEALPDSGEKGHEDIQPQWKYWKILWLDDQESDASPLYKELVKRLGSEDKVILCKTYEEALLNWEEDKAYGEISLVICDYRLKDAYGLPTSKQGYDFMKYLANEGRNVGKIAYSGLKRKFLIESFRHYGLQISIYSKIDFNQYNKDDLAFLSDEIIRLGDSHWIEINNAPRAQEWKNIAPTYHAFKDGFSFYTFQNYISRLVKQNLEIFFESFNKQSTKEDLWNLTFTDSFTVRTGGIANNEKKIGDVLIARRLAIGLYAFLFSNLNNQELLKEKEYTDFIKVVLYNSSQSKLGFYRDKFFDGSLFNVSKNKLERRYIQCPQCKSKVHKEKNCSICSYDIEDFVFNQGIKYHATLKQLFNKNALTFESTWPLGLLPEEFGWLKFDMGLVKETYDEIHNYLRQVQIIKRNFQFLFFEKHFNKLIHKEEGIFKVSGGKIHFNDDNVPYIRNTADAKRLVQAVYDGLDINDFEAHKHFISFWRRLVSQLNRVDFKESKFISNFLYFLTKTLKATKFDSGFITDELLRHDSSKLKILFERFLEIASILKNQTGRKIDTRNLSKNYEEFKQLSPYSKVLVKDVLEAMINLNTDDGISVFLIEIIEDITANQMENYITKIKTSSFLCSDFTYSIEQEYIIKYRPWEMSYPKHHRLKSNFQDISDELFEAIESKKWSYMHNNLENRNNIWSDTITDFIGVYHNPDNPNKYLDIYFRAIAYARIRADLYNEQKLTENRSRIRKNGDEITAIENAENKLAQRSKGEQIEYFSSSLDEDPSLRLGSDYSDYSDHDDIW